MLNLPKALAKQKMRVASRGKRLAVLISNREAPPLFFGSRKRSSSLFFETPDARSLRTFTAIAPGSLRPHRPKLSCLTRYPCVPNDFLIVSYMAKHDPDLSLLFHALADPTRRSMLTRLAVGPAAVTDLAAPTGLSLPTVMRHLSVLEQAGLIATSKGGRVRTCAIRAEAMEPARAWIDQQKAIWEARLDRLDALVISVLKEREK